MVSPYRAAVETAANILSIYKDKYGDEPFPTIKGKLSVLLEAQAGLNGVDNVYVQRFKETMRPLVGQVRRYDAVAGAYRPMERHGVIYLCPSLELPWQRYLQVKETAHLILDKEPDWVRTDTDMDNLLVQLAQFGQQPITVQFNSEIRAQVLATEILFPRESRDALRDRYDAGGISPGAIGKAARIPAEVVRMAMNKDYYEHIDSLYGK